MRRYLLGIALVCCALPMVAIADVPVDQSDAFHTGLMEGPDLAGPTVIYEVRCPEDYAFATIEVAEVSGSTPSVLIDANAWSVAIVAPEPIRFQLRTANGPPPDSPSQFALASWTDAARSPHRRPPDPHAVS